MQGGIDMRRRTFDTLAVIGGFVLAIVLAAGGGLLLWGHNVVTDQVHTQLAAQKIVFPAAGSPEIKALPATDATAMKVYAGQLMTSGAQAKTYANNFIAVHLAKIGGGKTYSQLSGLSLTHPTNAALAAQVQTVFRGETLRGLLLNAYGWWQMGQIMLIGSIVAFAAAAVLLILAGPGIAHRRRAAAEAEIFSRGTAAPAHAA
jgi:hypothetical protein